LRPKILLRDQAARLQILKGVDRLADAVKVTLGPMGRNVMLERPGSAPTVTKDGRSVAREIAIENRFQNIGAQMVKAVAEKTADMAGDGTTTATILAQAIFHDGLRLVAAGMDPMDLKRGIDKATASAVLGLKRLSMPCQDTKAITQVATISANWDEAIGRLVGEAIEAVGREGIVTVEAGTTTEDRIEIVDGMQFDCGYLSPFFINDQSSMTARLEKPLVLLFANKCSSVSELLPLLGIVADAGQPLLLIAADFSSEVLTLLVVNGLRGIIRVAAVKAPGFGDRRTEMLADIATVLGATVIADSTGLTLEKTTIENLGTAGQICVSKSSTTIIDGGGERKSIDRRSAKIRRQIGAATTDHDQQMLEQRLAKLVGGVAVIKVGAASDIEMTEKKARIEDALHAARAAAEEGIVPGGGLALLRICPDIEATETDNDDQAAGVRLLQHAIEAPFRQIVANGGGDPAVALNTANDGAGNFGYNAVTEQFGDLVKMGVIDPTKVTRLALQNAVSIAGLLLTIEVAVTAA
jgi:chaperonin GroEL